MRLKVLLCENWKLDNIFNVLAMRPLTIEKTQTQLALPPLYIEITIGVSDVV
jgi:hypothetical protein